MVHLMRTVDRALGYAFVADIPESSASVGISPAGAAPSQLDNRHALFSSAASLIPDAPKVQDVQERWVDHKQEWDEWETGEWRREGIAVAAEKERVRKEKEKAMKQGKGGLPAR